MIRILIIEREEDRQATVSCLSSQKGMRVIGFGKDGYDALKLTESLKPDVTVFDLVNEGVDGPGIIPLLKRKSPDTAVVVFTPPNNEAMVRKAVNSGAAACLLKSEDAGELERSIRIAYVGGNYISPRISGKIAVFVPEPVKRQDPAPAKSAISKLSLTELRIISCIGQTRSNKEIAERLKLTQGTIRNYISSAMRKTGLKNRTQIALYAVQNGLTDLCTLRLSTKSGQKDTIRQKA
jgi:DNA-binding NarL/FixJ family response regulator